jgi:Tfp pilus assembly PilM family ATPase
MDIFNRFSAFFREEALVGLDIGEDYITAARLFSKEDGDMKIEKLGWMEKEPEAPPRTVASLIKKLWSAHQIATPNVCSCLHSPSLFLKYFKYPFLAKDELKSALLLEAEQAFQRPQKELFIDWHLNSKSPLFKKEQTNATQEGILIAVPEEEVKTHLAILEMAGLYPIILDLSFTAISNLFLKLKNSPKLKVNCLVNITGRNADIVILSENSYIYPRNIYSRDTSWQKRPDYLIKNIEDALRYYQFKLRRKPVESLIFTGGTPFSEKFKEDIKKAVELPVEFWNPLKELRLKQDISAQDIETYGPIMATSLGLAMRRERDNGL